MTVLTQQTLSVPNVWTKIFTTPPDGTIEVLGIRYVNNGADQVTLQFASTPTNVAPASILFNIQPPIVLPGFDGSEETNIAVMPGACIWIMANSSLISCFVSGVGG
jgi:hypothetical protein